MSDNLNEQKDKEEILKLVSEYCDKYHKKPDYVEGQRIPYASRVYDNAEMVNLVDSSLEFWLTSGRYTDEFESEFDSLSLLLKINDNTAPKNNVKIIHIKMYSNATAIMAWSPSKKVRFYDTLFEKCCQIK